MVEIYGLKFKTTSFSEIENVIKTIQNQIDNNAKIYFSKLLIDEIVYLVDNIAINSISRPENLSILDCAIQNLNQRISLATARGYKTRYNLQVSGHILTLDNDTYLLIQCENDTLLENVFTLNDIIDDISVVSGLAGQKADEKETMPIWKKLFEKYPQGENSLGIKFAPNKNYFDETLLVDFPEKKERAVLLARHKLQNQILSMLSNEQQIAPYDLMHLVDLTIEELLEAKHYNSVQTAENELMNILPDITLELIKNSNKPLSLNKSPSKQKKKK